jgi:hypothetical protein
MIAGNMDAQNPVAQALLATLTEWIDKKRDSLERVTLDEKATAYLRGQVKAYRTVAKFIIGEPTEDDSSS